MKTIWIKTGDPVPKEARWLKQENKITGYDEAPHWMMNDEPIWESFDFWIIEEDK